MGDLIKPVMWLIGHREYPGTYVVRTEKDRDDGWARGLPVAALYDIDPNEAASRIAELEAKLTALVDRVLTYSGPCIIIPAKNHGDAIRVVREARDVLAIKDQPQ